MVRTAIFACDISLFCHWEPKESITILNTHSQGGSIAKVVLCLSLLTPVATGAPVPSLEELRPVQSELREFYRAELDAADTPEKQIKLSMQLLDHAIDASDDALTQYALLKAAQSLAIKGEDFNLALDVADGIAVSFEVRRCLARAEVIGSLRNSKSAFRKEDKVTLAREAFRLIDPVLDCGRVDIASSLANFSASNAHSARSFRLYRQANSELDDIRTLALEENAYKAALKRLAEAQDDQAAKKVVGAFICFVRGTWERGLPFLLDSGDEELAELASDSLKHGNNRVQLMAADHWWEYSENLDGRRSRVVKRFAADLYRETLSDLDGIRRKKAESRLAAWEKIVEDREDHLQEPRPSKQIVPNLNELAKRSDGKTAEARVASLSRKDFPLLQVQYDEGEQARVLGYSRREVPFELVCSFNAKVDLPRPDPPEIKVITRYGPGQLRLHISSGYFVCNGQHQPRLTKDIGGNFRRSTIVNGKLVDAEYVESVSADGATALEIMKSLAKERSQASVKLVGRSSERELQLTQTDLEGIRQVLAAYLQTGGLEE